MTEAMVRAAFARMAGISQEEASRQGANCTLAMEEITRRLRPGIVPEDHQKLLTQVCAALVNYWYRLEQNTSHPSGKFTSNKMSVITDLQEELDHAYRLREEWMSAASHLLEYDGGFAFLPTGKTEEEETA